MKRRTVLIEVKNAVKKYGYGDGTIYALNDVSMKVYKGEFLVILGYSGSGKSTLLNMIGGIDKLDSGSIIFNHKDITKFRDRELTKYRKNSVAYIFQFFNLINDLTILQNITITPSFIRDREYIRSVLKRVGLYEKRDSFPRQLSGGQQQRASIARALCKKSDMILGDEPTGALDYESGKDVLRLLEEIHKEGRTIVMVTHTKEIASIADRVITMKNGKIISETVNDNIKNVDEIDW